MKRTTKALWVSALTFFAAAIAFGLASLCSGFHMDEFVQAFEEGKFTVDGSMSWTKDVQDAVTDVFDSGSSFSRIYTDEIKSLKLQTGAIDCRIILTDEDVWRVNGYQLPLRSSCELQGNTLKIDCSRRIWNYIGFGNKQGQLELYIPRDQIIEKIKVDAGAGNIRVEDGMLKCEQLKLDCGVGETDIYLDVGKEVDIDGGVGEIRLTLAGEAEDFNYDIDCGVGSINIDGDHHTNLGGEYKIDNLAEKDLRIDCGVGAVEISFKKQPD